MPAKSTDALFIAMPRSSTLLSDSNFITGEPRNANPPRADSMRSRKGGGKPIEVKVGCVAATILAIYDYQ